MQSTLTLSALVAAMTFSTPQVNDGPGIVVHRDQVVPIVLDDTLTLSGSHPGTDAYYKGRKGEQLDNNKKR